MKHWFFSDPHFGHGNGRISLLMPYSVVQKIRSQYGRDGKVIHRKELCNAEDILIQMHHVRKLADLRKPGRGPKEEWQKIMAARKRKMLAVRSAMSKSTPGDTTDLPCMVHWRAGGSENCTPGSERVAGKGSL